MGMGVTSGRIRIIADLRRMAKAGTPYSITRMQRAALTARLATRSHAEAAESLHLSLIAFQRRFARGLAKMPFGVRNRYRSMLPRPGKPKVIRTRQLSDFSNF